LLRRAASSLSRGRVQHVSQCQKSSKAKKDDSKAKILTQDEEECGTPENPKFFKDPDRVRRVLSGWAHRHSQVAGRKERNFTKDGFDFPQPIRHGLGDFRTPHPGPYPENLPKGEDPESDWDNSRASPEELQQLEYRYSIPNYETENFSFDRETGILQEPEDEKDFYEKVVLPKTGNLPFRHKLHEGNRELDYEVSKDPAEWAYVDRLVPSGRVIKTDFDYGKEYPSGYVPPNPAVRQDESGHEYYVGRTRNGMMPVYTRYDRITDAVTTDVKKCEGNMYRLKEELDAYLFEKYEQSFPSQVAELYGRIAYRGDFEQEFKEFLVQKGF